MDIQNKTNKMMGMGSDVIEDKDVQPTTIKAASQLENEYFYPESNGYQAITIRAATRQDAQAIYLERRKPIDPVKVAEQTNNE
jgi:hypothetical protein